MAIDILNAFRVEPPPLDFVLPGLLAGTVGSLVSPGGTGKSLLALELSILVAIGLDISGFGRGVARSLGKVAFLAAEDPAEALRHRLHAIGKCLNQEQQIAFSKSFEIEPLVGIPTDLCDPASLAYIEAKAVGRRLMFLDTLRRFHTLDENNSGEMASVMGFMEGIAVRTECAIVFLHHASKSAAMNGLGDQQQAGRGSSVLVDNSRWQAFLAGCSKDEAKEMGIDDECRGSFVRLGVAKQNYDSRVDDLWLRRMAGGVLFEANLSNHFGSVRKSSLINDAHEKPAVEVWR